MPGTARSTYTEFAEKRVAYFSGGFAIRFSRIDLANRRALASAFAWTRNSITGRLDVTHLVSFSLHERETSVFMSDITVRIEHVLARSVLVLIETEGVIELELNGLEAAPIGQDPSENGPPSTPEKPEKNGDGP